MVAVAPALLQLRAQLDEAYPDRARASDGGLPSAAHTAANPTSDHETGNAFDFTYDPNAGPDLDALALALLADPNRRTHYVIWNRQIANVEIQAAAWRPYSGASAHTEHLHLSIYPDRRDDVALWDLGDGAPAGAPARAAAPDELGAAEEHQAGAPAAPEAPAPRAPSRARVGRVVVGLGVALGAALGLASTFRRPASRRP